MLTYLLQSSLCAILFYVIYELGFKPHTNHRFNRLYLMSAMLFSIAIPWVEISIGTEIVRLAALPNSANDFSTASNTPVSIFTFREILSFIYILGLTISLSIFLLKLIKLISTIRNGAKNSVDGYNIAIVKEEIGISSFLKWIIVPKSQESTISNFEISHEKAHLNQSHTLDIITAWIYQSFFWFNPIAYLYKIRLSEVHEFLADEDAIKEIGKSSYQEYILNVVSQRLQPQLVNNFNSIIKTRLTMMNSNSKPNKWSYLTFFSASFMSVFFFSCQTNKIVKTEQFPLANSKWLSETVGDTTIIFDAQTFDEIVTISKTYLQYRLDSVISMDLETNVESLTIEKTYSDMSKDFLRERYELHPKRDSLLNLLKD